MSVLLDSPLSCLLNKRLQAIPQARCRDLVILQGVPARKLLNHNPEIAKSPS